jgi:hypothetical protein
MKKVLRYLAVAVLLLSLSGADGQTRGDAVQAAAAEAVPVPAPAVPAIAFFPARRRQPATPTEMALTVEQELAQGAGALLPFPDMTVKLDGGVIPLSADRTSFPPEFLAGLLPEKAGQASGLPVEDIDIWRAALRVDDATGDMIFRNADGVAFWTVPADPGVYAPDWIARLRSPSRDAAKFTEFFARGDAENAEDSGLALSPLRVPAVLREQITRRAAWSAARQYLRPSHIEMIFTFVMEEDLAAFRAARRAAGASLPSIAAPRPLLAASPSSAAAPAGLAFTAISNAADEITLELAWPPGMAFAGRALDLFFTSRLESNAWTRILRAEDIEPSDGGLGLGIPRAFLPPPPAQAPPAAVTNIQPSVYSSSAVNIAIFVTNALWLADAGFFRAADATDSDGDGRTDACEEWEEPKSDPHDPDTNRNGLPDGTEWDLGFDPSGDPMHAADDPEGNGLSLLDEWLLEAAGSGAFPPADDPETLSVLTPGGTP